MVEKYTVWWYNSIIGGEQKVLDEREFKARIEYARILANYNKTELAEKLNMPASTFRRKMDKPTRLTIEEFFVLTEVLPNGVLISYLKEAMGIKALKRIPLRKGILKRKAN
jgi:hypothetical protein